MVHILPITLHMKHHLVTKRPLLMQSRSSPTPHTKKRKQPSKGYKFSKCSSKESLHHPLAKCCSSSSLENPVEAKGSTTMYHPSHVEYLCCLPMKKKKNVEYLCCRVPPTTEAHCLLPNPTLHEERKESNAPNHAHTQYNKPL